MIISLGFLIEPSVPCVPSSYVPSLSTAGQRARRYADNLVEYQVRRYQYFNKIGGRERRPTFIRLAMQGDGVTRLANGTSGHRRGVIQNENVEPVLFLRLTPPDQQTESITLAAPHN